MHSPVSRSDGSVGRDLGYDSSPASSHARAVSAASRAAIASAADIPAASPATSVDPIVELRRHVLGLGAPQVDHLDLADSPDVPPAQTRGVARAMSVGASVRSFIHVCVCVWLTRVAEGCRI